MNEPMNPQPEPRGPNLTPEELAIIRERSKRPSRFFTSDQVRGLLRALEEEAKRNPAFGPADLKPFMERFHATQPAHYTTADGQWVTFMPDE